MVQINEAGVLAPSQRFFNTPSSAARQLFYYLTQIGRYDLDERYDFLDSSPAGQLPAHKTYELIFVDAGAMEIFNDGRRMLVDAGQVALVDCHRSHRFRALRTSHMIFLHFEGPNVAAFFEQIMGAHAGHFAFTPPAGGSLRADLITLYDARRTGAALTEAETSQVIHRILCELLLPPRQPGWEEQDVIAQSVRYIREHLFEPLAVDRVAAAVNLSPSHFSRLFKSRTGYSPHEYIVLRRIDEAKGLLHATRLSVKEIAFRVGYHSEVNFISSFTAKTGVSPAAFRRNPI